MKFYAILIISILLFSCKEKPHFTQLEKDLDALQEKYSGEDSLHISKMDSISHPKIDKRKQDSETSISISNKREKLIAFAQNYLGTPYLYAGTTPEEGFDCSGFINYVFNHFGYEVPRSSKDFEFFGKEIPVQNAQIGDLVLFTETDLTSTTIGHIGIITMAKGMQSDFIHSSSGKANGVTISSLSSKHYSQRFVKVISVME